MGFDQICLMVVGSLTQLHHVLLVAFLPTLGGVMRQMTRSHRAEPGKEPAVLRQLKLSQSS